MDGRDLAGQLEPAPGIIVSVHHRAPQTESAKCAEKVARELGPRSVAGVDPGDRWRVGRLHYPRIYISMTLKSAREPVRLWTVFRPTPDTWSLGVRLPVAAVGRPPSLLIAMCGG